MGVFVQFNADNERAKRFPVGYLIQENGCWDWVGTKTRFGYGLARLGPRNTPLRQAHRMMYERHKGPIPKGLVIDHLCRNTSCVNPDHLEAVTQKENIRRGKNPISRHIEVPDAD